MGAIFFRSLRMRQPPGLSDFPKFPVTGGTCLLALGITLAWWAHLLDVSPLLVGIEVRQGQLWRLVTSALVHLDVLHLAFDVYWTWVFGSIIEVTLGHLACLLIFALLAAGSGAAQYAFTSGGGAGLSGVGYGLFGMLWVLTHRDRRFKDVIDSQTAGVFVAWFFFCIVLTYLGKPIGNVAHGMGFAMGALLGWGLSGNSAMRLVAGSVTAFLLAANLLAATIFRPWVNFSHDARAEAYVGYMALTDNQNQAALGWYRDAVRMDPANASYWYNLGVAALRLNDWREGKADIHRAVELDPSNKQYSAAEQDTDGATASK
jgi:GlpG protein